MIDLYTYGVPILIGLFGVFLIIEFIYSQSSSKHQKLRLRSIQLGLTIICFSLVTFTFAFDKRYIGTSIGVAALVWLWVSLRKRRMQAKQAGEDDVRQFILSGFMSEAPNTKRYGILTLILGIVIIFALILMLVR